MYASWHVARGGPLSVKLAPTARVVVTNTAALAAAQAVLLLCGIVNTAVLTRRLGPSTFGEYSAILAAVGLVAGVVANWGLETIAVREASQSPHEVEVLLGTTAGLQLAASVAAYVVLLPICSLFSVGHAFVPVAVAGLTLLLMPIDMLGLALQIQLRLGRAAAVNAIAAVCALATLMGAAYLGATMVGCILVYALGAAVRSILVLWTLRNMLTWSRVRFRRDLVLPLMREAWPVALSTIFVAITIQAPLLFLARSGLDDQAGYYSAASKITYQVSVIPVLLWSSLFPTFSRLASHDVVLLARLVGLVVRLMTVLAVIVCGLGISIVPWLVPILFGPAYRIVGAVLVPLLIQAGTLFPTIVAGESLVVLGRQGIALAIQIVGSIITVGACLALIAPFGALGAACGSLIGYSVIGACMVIWARRVLGPEMHLWWNTEDYRLLREGTSWRAGS